MLYFCTPVKMSETFGFLTFSRGIEIEHWANMGSYQLVQKQLSKYFLENILSDKIHKLPWKRLLMDTFSIEFKGLLTTIHIKKAPSQGFLSEFFETSKTIFNFSLEEL